MKNKSGLSTFLSMIVVLILGALIAYFAFLSTGLIKKDKMKVSMPETMLTAIKTYDGNYISIDDINGLSEVVVMEGHTVLYDIKNNFCNATKNYIYLSPTVINEEGRDVTDLYDFEFKAISALISKRILEIKLTSNKIGFLNYNEYKTYNGELISGHSIKVIESEGKLVPIVINNEGRDVTSNYDLKLVENSQGGDSTTPKPEESKYKITLKYLNYEKVYDGNPFDVKLEIVNNITSNVRIFAELLTSENLKASELVKPISTTYTVNKDTFKILETVDGVESDITNQCEIIFANDFGSINITPRNLNINYNIINKDYDGMVIDETTLEYKQTGLLPGDKIETHILNDLRNVVNAGSYELLVDAKITNKNEDVTDCYNISINTLKIVIKPLIYTIAFNQQITKSKFYDAQSLIFDTKFLNVFDNNNLPIASDIFNSIDIKFRYVYNNTKLVDEIYNAGTYNISIDSVRSYNSNIIYNYTDKFIYTVNQADLTFSFNTLEYSTLYRGHIIDMADETRQYTISGLKGNDMVKPVFSVKNTKGQNYLELYHASEYEVTFEHFDFLNTSNVNYNVSSIGDKMCKVIINPYVLSFESVTTIVEYDGKKHNVPTPKVVTPLLGQDHFEVFISKTLDVVGTATLTAMETYPEIKNSYGEDVSNDYENFSTATGTLIITKRKVTIETETKRFTYVPGNTNSLIATNTMCKGFLNSQEETDFRDTYLLNATYVDFKNFGPGIYENVISINKDLINTNYPNYEFVYILGKVIIE